MLDYGFALKLIIILPDQSAHPVTSLLELPFRFLFCTNKIVFSKALEINLP